MKRKELIIVNVFMGILITLFTVLTLNLSANEQLGDIAKNTLQPEDRSAAVLAANETKGCTTKKPLNLTNAIDQNLQKLADYQDFCDSFVAGKVMFFTAFPDSTASAPRLAADVAKKLKSFQAAGISPLVIVEPYAGDGLMPYRDYLNGEYDRAVRTFFASLKGQGVTDTMMGTWVPFPESNVPSWDNKDTEPSDFAACVNKYLAAMRTEFPQAHGSILLSATTYEPNDVEWENGDYLSLVPYVQDLDKDLVTSIGIQGFPWVSKATSVRREIFRASEFLQADIAIEAAQELRTRDIWFNTGSFASKYSNNSKETVTISLGDRKAIMNSILEEVRRVQTYQQNEYRVSINIFAEDKRKTTEATDWSYSQNEDSQAIFREFVRQAAELHIPLSLYDKAR
jgi:hypothetical protein